jgi:hypothetical protein
LSRSTEAVDVGVSEQVSPQQVGTVLKLVVRT